MEIDFAFLADAAATTRDGKIGVLGGCIEDIGATSFPVTLPLVSLVLRVLLRPSECGREHQIEIVFVDQDGNPQGINIKGGFALERNKMQPTRSVSWLAAINMPNLAIASVGDYEFLININGEQRKAIPLYVRQVETPTLPTPDAPQESE